jgi:hypothetical protein
MQHRPYRSGIRLIRTAITLLLVGAAVTVAVAWGCAMWSPVSATVDPFPNPTGVADTVDPDGVVGLHARESGFGWTYMSLRGERSVTNDRENLFWSGPYGGVFHRAAGWPLPALRSRVEVLDSQVSGRLSEGQPEPEVVTQRRRWDLPTREIVYRGIPTKDLPAWLHADPDRRVPLVPIALGFAINTLTYAIAFALVASVCRAAWRRLRPAPRGFAVATEGAA